jgi:4,5-DOPA dioxygenase extradiol
MLAGLRAQGVLILGSGNMVHNLGLYDPDPDAKPYEWALKFDAAIKNELIARNVKSLTAPKTINTQWARLAMPTAEHYLPLLYVVGASRREDRLSFPYEGFQGASMSMRMVLYSS